MRIDRQPLQTDQFDFDCQGKQDDAYNCIISVVYFDEQHQFTSNSTLLMCNRQVEIFVFIE
jgi:hypothetical protein